MNKGLIGANIVLCILLFTSMIYSSMAATSASSGDTQSAHDSATNSAIITGLLTFAVGAATAGYVYLSANNKLPSINY